MKEPNGEHPLGDAGQLILLALFLGVWAADSLFLHLSTFLSVRIPLPFRLGFLALALGAAVYLGSSGHRVVHHGEQGPGLVSSGAFRYVRHPLYLACLLVYLGLAVATASLACLVLLAGIFVFYDTIAGYEEKLLEEKYGQAYKAYKARTGKWVPKRGREVTAS